VEISLLAGSVEYIQVSISFNNELEYYLDSDLVKFDMQLYGVEGNKVVTLDRLGLIISLESVLLIFIGILMLESVSLEGFINFITGNRGGKND
jgi:hypothetical protein